MIAPWLSVADFIAAAGISRRTFFRNRSTYQMKLDGRTLMVSSASLPSEACSRLKLEPESLGSPRIEAERPTVPAQVPACDPPLFAGVAAQGKGRRILLSAEQERLALEKLQILRPLLDFCSDPAARNRYQLLQVAPGRSVRTSDDMADYLVQTHSSMRLSRPTLWRWKKSFEADGLTGLARKLREDKGRSKWAERWPAAAKLVTATYLQPWQTKQTAYDALVRDSAMLGIANADLPSYAAVCDFLSTLPAAPVVLAREGERAHAARFATYLTRGYTDIAPNSVWVSDHAIHDVEVRNDCFFGIPENAPMRLRLTALMDLRSRMVVGYTWTPEGNSRSISTVLRDAVRKYGPCDTFYCDNGKDFQKVGRFAAAANQSEHIESDMLQVERAGVLRMLGIKVQYCIKYHPQSKPIERMFRTLHLGLDAILPHYTTGNSYMRPDRINADGATHRKLFRMGEGDRSPLMPASLFIGMAATWIEEDYNRQHAHSGRGMDGRTPHEVFHAGWSQNSRRPMEDGVLDMLLWTRQRRLVRNCAVQVSNRRLIGATAYDTEVLYRLPADNEVIVCFDPNAPDAAVITDQSGIKLCDVRAESYVPQSAEAGPMIAASMQERRGLRNDSAASIRSLRREVSHAGHRTPAQHLHDRAQEALARYELPMAVGDHITQRVVEEQAAPVSSAMHTEDIIARFQARREGR
jgi:putative transposase